MKTSLHFALLILLTAGCASYEEPLPASSGPSVIRGTVLHSDGSPAEGIEVLLERFQSPEWLCFLPLVCMGSYRPLAATRTSTTGQFELVTYVDGIYMLLVKCSKDRYRGLSESLETPMSQLKEFEFKLSECEKSANK